VTIFRPFNIYGKGQNREFLIPSIKDQIENSNMITLRDPRPKRDFVHVDDVVEAYRLAVESDDQFLRIFNLGYGKSYSVKEIVEKIILKQKKKIQVKYTHEYRKDEVLDTIADISRVRSELKWEPKIDIDKGLEY
jgi:UDP-glucose 4-epimerase